MLLCVEVEEAPDNETKTIYVLCYLDSHALLQLVELEGIEPSSGCAT